MHKIQAHGDTKHCQMKFHTFQSTYPNVIHNHCKYTIIQMKLKPQTLRQLWIHIKIQAYTIYIKTSHINYTLKILKMHKIPTPNEHL